MILEIARNPLENGAQMAFDADVGAVALVPVGCITVRELFKLAYRGRYGRPWGAVVDSGRDWDERFYLRVCSVENSRRVQIWHAFCKLLTVSQIEFLIFDRAGNPNRLSTSSEQLQAMAPLLMLTGTIRVSNQVCRLGNNDLIPVVPRSSVEVLLTELDRPLRKAPSIPQAAPVAPELAHRVATPKKPRGAISESLHAELQNRWIEFHKTNEYAPNRECVAEWIKVLEPARKGQVALAQEFINSRPNRRRRGRPKIAR